MIYSICPLNEDEMYTESDIDKIFKSGIKQPVKG